MNGAKTSVESRKIVLRMIKDYYSSKQKKLEPKDVETCAMLDVVCENEEACEAVGYIPVFAEDEITQVFYNYRTGESFVALNMEDEYTALPDTYSNVSSFAANIAINMGLCYRIFTRELELVDDPELSEALAKEEEQLRQYLFGKKKLYIK